VIKANNFDAEFLGINYPALTSRSKLLLIFMMFFAILPDYKYNLCPKTLGKAKQAIKLR
jgi:hypothetical protein